MGISYVIVALIIILMNYQNIPSMFYQIFQDAFNFQSIFGGVAGSCMVYGIKRGLFSNEAVVGSAPNASASANVSPSGKAGSGANIARLYRHIASMYSHCINVPFHRSGTKCNRCWCPICAKIHSDSIRHCRPSVHHSCNGAFRIYNIDWKYLLCRQCPDIFK